MNGGGTTSIADLTVGHQRRQSCSIQWGISVGFTRHQRLHTMTGARARVNIRKAGPWLIDGGKRLAHEVNRFMRWRFIIFKQIMHIQGEINNDLLK
jgi:hypothetical protein